MYSPVMESFLSKENIKLHLSHLNDLKLKYSILEKSCPILHKKRYSDVYSMKLSREVKQEALELLYKIEAHEIYFSSFCEKNQRCDFLRKYFPSKEAFLYEIFLLAKTSKSDFLFISTVKKGKPVISFEEDTLMFNPLLVLDLAEHSYFGDYGFDREEYIRRAISVLDLAKLENR